MKALVFAAALVATPALAEFDKVRTCEEMWYARNAVMNRAGYCFDSALGKALFDNGDCTGKEVALTSEQRWVVRFAQKMEADLGCKVDTSRTRLDLYEMTRRRALLDIAPARDDGGYMCVGYTGRALTLHLGHSASTPVVGRAKAGDNLSYHFEHGGAPAGWSLVTARRDNKTTGLGWVNAVHDAALCGEVIP